VFTTAQLRQNALLLHLPIKPFEQTVKALILTGFYLSHVASSSFKKKKLYIPSHFSHPRLPCQEMRLFGDLTPFIPLSLIRRGGRFWKEGLTPLLNTPHY
jgi:hypothetical protein